MTTEEFQLFERRIDNCFKASDETTDDDMRHFWIQTACALLRKLNIRMHGSVVQPDRTTDF